MIFITDETVTDCEGMHGPTAELFIYSVNCRDTFIGGAEFPSLRRVYIEKKKQTKKTLYIAIPITFQSNKEEYNSFIFT